MLKKIAYLFKSDVVMFVSMCLAIVSCIIVPPSAQYLQYIDFHTLILLFCLMLIVEGLREQGFFQAVGNWIFTRIKTTKGLVFSLVFLCFFSSMLITNDVTLITFIPFGILILEMAGLTPKLCLTVTLMTIAANLGSMFTPIGNPQNLYLFSISHLDLPGFFMLMLPFTAVSAVLLGVFILFGYRQSALEIHIGGSERLDKRSVCFYGVLFVLCVLAVAGVVPAYLLLPAVVLCVFCKKKTLFKKIDYSLLLTFSFFFIFVGNINQMENLRAWISGIVQHHERMVSVGISQVISNVPAAMLLSGYTENINELIIGTNLGGLGTLIASMASLISYKHVANRYPEFKKKYLLLFTLCNLVFLVFLCLL